MWIPQSKKKTTRETTSAFKELPSTTAHLHIMVGDPSQKFAGRSNSHIRRIVVPFCFGVGLVFFANVASYFLLSAGYGVLPINDGVIAIGFPFVIFEQGGLAGREDFYIEGAVGDLLIALFFGALAASVRHFMTKHEEVMKS